MGLNLKIEDEHGRSFYGRDIKSGKEHFRIGEEYKVYCPNVTLTYKWDPTLAVFGKSLTAGELGAYCSHVEVMFDVMKNRHKSVVVFEDDVVLPDDFAVQLKKIERSMPNYKNYDMIFLGYNKVFSKRWLENKFKVKKIPFNDALEAVTSHRGLVGSVYAHMYGYPGAERRLSYLQPRAGIDMDSFRLANSDLIKTFKVRHINVEQASNMVSQITDMGREH